MDFYDMRKNEDFGIERLLLSQIDSRNLHLKPIGNNFNNELEGKFLKPNNNLNYHIPSYHPLDIMFGKQDEIQKIQKFENSTSIILQGLENANQHYFLNNSAYSPNIVESFQRKLILENIKKKEERRQKIERYKQKKRNWEKKINYDCRKSVAEKRQRIEGRFISKLESEKIQKLMTNQEKFNNKNNLILDKFQFIFKVLQDSFIMKTEKISNKYYLKIYEDLLNLCTNFYISKVKHIEESLLENSETEIKFKIYDLKDPFQEILYSQEKEADINLRFSIEKLFKNTEKIPIRRLKKINKVKSAKKYEEQSQEKWEIEFDTLK